MNCSLNPEVLTVWRDATGLLLHEGYGQTETIVLIGNFRSLGRPIRPGSMGLPTPGLDVTLVDEECREVRPGTEGEVALRVNPVRPIGLFHDYCQNTAEVQKQFRGDFYLTGDRAVKDAEGYFTFIGRNDDVIKSSGYRIGPFEVESALLAAPGRARCCGHRQTGCIARPISESLCCIAPWLFPRRGPESGTAISLQETGRRL